MHVGMIVGIGPAATDYYYRYLIKAFGLANRDLQLTMAHADTKTLLKNQAEGNNQAQVDIYVSLADRLQKMRRRAAGSHFHRGPFLHPTVHGGVTDPGDRPS